MGEGRVRLHRGERLEAVHLRHHEVEQDEVHGRAGGKQVQRLPAVGGLSRLVAEPFEEPDHGHPVHPAVVNDEDVARAQVSNDVTGVRPRAPRRRGHALHPASRAAASAS